MSINGSVPVFVSASSAGIAVAAEGRNQLSIPCAKTSCGTAAVGAELDEAVVSWVESSQGSFEVWAARISLQSWTIDAPFVVDTVGWEPSVVVFSGEAYITYSSAFGARAARVSFDTSGAPSIETVDLAQWTLCESGESLTSVTHTSASVVAAVAIAKTPDSSCPPCLDCVTLDVKLFDITFLTGSGPSPGVIATLFTASADHPQSTGFGIESFSADANDTDELIAAAVAIADTGGVEIPFVAYEMQTGVATPLRTWTVPAPTNGWAGAQVSVSVRPNGEIAALVGDGDPNFGPGSIVLLRDSLADFPTTPAVPIADAAYDPHIFDPAWSPAGCTAQAVWDDAYQKSGFDNVTFSNLTSQSSCR